MPRFLINKERPAGAGGNEEYSNSAAMLCFRTVLKIVLAPPLRTEVYEMSFYVTG
jgi:hypothetical protein